MKTHVERESDNSVKAFVQLKNGDYIFGFGVNESEALFNLKERVNIRVQELQSIEFPSIKPFDGSVYNGQIAIFGDQVYVGGELVGTVIKDCASYVVVENKEGKQKRYYL